MIRVLVYFVAGLLACLPQISLGRVSPETRRAVQKAEKLIGNERYEEAAIRLEEVIQQEPSAAKANRLLGHAYFELGQLQRARRAFVNSISHGSLSADVFDRLAYIDQKQGRELISMVELELATVLNPTNNSYKLAMADQAIAAGRLELARAVYGQMLRDDPADAELHLRLANLYLQLQQPQRALISFQASYYLGQPSVALVRNIAELQIQIGDLDEAVSWFERVISLGAEDWSALRLRQAQLLFQLGDLDEARQKADAARADEAGVSAAAAHLLLGQIAMLRNEKESAVNHWEKAAADRRLRRKVAGFLGNYHFSHGNYDKAAVFLDTATRSDSPDPGMHRSLVRCLVELQQLETAESELRRYVEHNGIDDYVRSLAKNLPGAKLLGAEATSADPLADGPAF